MYIPFFCGINYKGTATTSEVHLEAEQKEPQIMHCMTCDDVYPFPCFHSLHDSSERLASERVSDITQFRIFMYPASSEVVITVEQVVVS